ncbi:MAG: FHA domain-containing protein, partial [Myxococcaceae bacterium]|nr:FHA domain-containing protein [Myxococcaceae bacterium]
NATWTVRDAGSKNGSTLDGVKLEPGAPQTLKTGSKLSAGGVTFTFYAPAGMLARLKV